MPSLIELISSIPSLVKWRFFLIKSATLHQSFKSFIFQPISGYLTKNGNSIWWISSNLLITNLAILEVSSNLPQPKYLIKLINNFRSLECWDNIKIKVNPNLLFASFFVFT